MWGWGFVNLWPTWEKKPMCLIPLFLLPTTLIEELLLVVESVNDFGSGVAGMSVLAYALHSIRPHPSCRLFLLPTSCKMLKTCNSCPPHCCSYSRTGISRFPHVVLSPTESWMLWLYFSLPDWFVGLHCLFLTHRWGGCELIPSVAYVCFPSDFVAQDDCGLSPVVIFLLLLWNGREVLRNCLLVKL